MTPMTRFRSRFALSKSLKIGGTMLLCSIFSGRRGGTMVPPRRPEKIEQSNIVPPIFSDLESAKRERNLVIGVIDHRSRRQRPQHVAAKIIRVKVVSLGTYR